MIKTLEDVIIEQAEIITMLATVIRNGVLNAAEQETMTKIRLGMDINADDIKKVLDSNKAPTS